MLHLDFGVVCEKSRRRMRVSTTISARDDHEKLSIYSTQIPNHEIEHRERDERCWKRPKKQMLIHKLFGRNIRVGRAHFDRGYFFRLSSKSAMIFIIGRLTNPCLDPYFALPSDQ